MELANTRNDLINAVCSGKLTIKDAELLALNKNFEPLEELADFNTSEREYLSLSEALVWIKYRDHKTINRVNDIWRSKSKFFRQTLDPKNPFQYGPAECITYLELDQFLEGQMNNIFKSLCEKLEIKLINVFFKSEDGILKIFPPVDWSNVELGMNSKNLKPAIRFSNRKDLWLSNSDTDNCCIKSYQLQAAYPANDITSINRSYTDSEIRQKIFEIVEKLGRLPSADMIYKILKQENPTIKRDSIRLIVKQLTNSRDRGRPSKALEN